jgi:hypothetical protein
MPPPWHPIAIGVAAKEENPWRKDEGQASVEEQLRGDEDLFVGAAVEGGAAP